MNKKSWIAFTIITVGLLAFLIIFSKNSQTTDLSKLDPFAPQLASEQNGQIGDQIFGNKDSKIILINYGDFQCGGCDTASPAVKNVVEKYKDKMMLIFRNVTLSYHTNSKAASAAAEAAGLQDKYWEMHALIYELQASWSSLGVDDRTAFFNSLAEQLELDINKFKEDMVSQKVSDKIAYDKALGDKAGVHETPTFYLNDEKLESDVWGNEASLSKRIDEELNKKSE